MNPKGEKIKSKFDRGSMCNICVLASLCVLLM